MAGTWYLYLMWKWSGWRGPEISIPANINGIQCSGWRRPESANIKDASVIRIAWTWHFYPCKYKSNTVFRMTGTRVRKYKRCYSDPDGGDLRSLFNVKVIRMEGTWDLYSCKYKSNTSGICISAGADLPFQQHFAAAKMPKCTCSANGAS